MNASRRLRTWAIAILSCALLHTLSANSDAKTLGKSGCEPGFWREHALVLGKLVSVRATEEPYQFVLKVHVESASTSPFLKNWLRLGTIEVEHNPGFRGSRLSILREVRKKFVLGTSFLAVVHEHRKRLVIDGPVGPCGGGTYYFFLPNHRNALCFTNGLEESDIADTLEYGRVSSIADPTEKYIAIVEAQASIHGPKSKAWLLGMLRSSWDRTPLGISVLQQLRSQESQKGTAVRLFADRQQTVDEIRCADQPRAG